jgi:hypothetical protein
VTGSGGPGGAGGWLLRELLLPLDAAFLILCESHPARQDGCYTNLDRRDRVIEEDTVRGKNNDIRARCLAAAPGTFEAGIPTNSMLRAALHLAASGSCAKISLAPAEKRTVTIRC